MMYFYIALDLNYEFFLRFKSYCGLLHTYMYNIGIYSIQCTMYVEKSRKFKVLMLSFRSAPLVQSDCSEISAQLKLRREHCDSSLERSPQIINSISTRNVVRIYCEVTSFFIS